MGRYAPTIRHDHGKRVAWAPPARCAGDRRGRSAGATRAGSVDRMTEIESSTRWTIHGERVIDESRRLRLSIAEVELPDGVRFEQYVLRLPKAAIMVVLDDPGERVLMMWRHP